jgi:subtilisin family serine protease
MHALASQMAPSVRARFLASDLVPVLVDAADAGQIAGQVQQWHGTCQPLTATTLHVHVPRNKLRELAVIPGVNYVEASNKLRPHCDLAHVSAGLVVDEDRVVPQRGRNVLIGIVDTGIDAAHLAFKKGAQTRIVRYLDQTTGKEYDADAINNGQAAASPDKHGHGTHVAGIAAGNGRGAGGSAYAGVAPEADLAIVKTTFQSNDIAAGVKYLFDVAEERQQACVVNLSLGGHFGGHDGSTVTERTIDQLSGRGRIVVVSAGNEGRDPIHASTVLPRGQAAPASWKAHFQLKLRQDETGRQFGLLIVQIWHQHEDSLDVRVRAPNGESFQPPSLDQKEFDRSVFLVQCSHQVAPYSGDHVTTFTVIAQPESQWLSGWSILVEEKRQENGLGVHVGAVHAWILNDDMGAFTSGATVSHLVGMPGTAYSAITVGSYATRKSWKSQDPNLPVVDLNAVHLEDVSYFSSPGPTRDGDTKPEISAPGQWLISALSAGAPGEEVPSWLRVKATDYAAMQGTSMAAPYVTGALALLLEKDAKIDWAEAKRRLIKSARQDAFTAPCWNQRWGYGRIHVARLLEIEP